MYLREIEVTLIIEDSTCLSNAINDDLYRVITNLQDAEAIMILINIDISLFKIESGLRKELKFSEKNKLTKAIKKARLLGLLPFTDKHKIEENK